MKLAILTPSRMRPEGLYKFFESINKTISGEHGIDLVIGIDNDDPLKQEYRALLKKMKSESVNKLHVVMAENDRKLLAQTWNSLIKYSSADWFTCGNDDEIYITPLWDKILFNRISGHPYKLYWFDDGLQHGNHCAFPILSKEWIKTVGYYFPECFHHNYVDTWVFDIATKLRVTNYIPEVKHLHLHYSIGLNQLDQTYKDGMTQNEQDKQLFYQTESQRNEIVEILKQKIWELGH